MYKTRKWNVWGCKNLWKTDLRGSTRHLSAEKLTDFIGSYVFRLRARSWRRWTRCGRLSTARRTARTCATTPHSGQAKDWSRFFFKLSANAFISNKISRKEWKLSQYSHQQCFHENPPTLAGFEPWSFDLQADAMTTAPPGRGAQWNWQCFTIDICYTYISDFLEKQWFDLHFFNN
jgi:hypothetical protein